jgi:hypothetical protein
MMNILAKRAIIQLTLFLITLGSSNTHMQGITGTSGLVEASEIWNAAVEAQGGRARLESVKSVLVQVGKHEDNVSLYALPDKFWTFTDWPSPFTSLMRMEDYRSRQNYILRRGQKQADLFPIAPERLAQSTDTSGNVIWMPTSTYLLESKWWKPTLLGSRHDGNMEVVETILFGLRTDYYFDSQTHLLLRELQYGMGDDKKRYISNFGKHVKVDGIVFPSEVTFPGESHPTPVSVAVNVNFDSGIFEHVPSAAFGPDAWKMPSKRL